MAEGRGAGGLVETAVSLASERMLRRLEWHVLRRLEGRLQGDFRTALRGGGTDFHGLRAYRDGDDVRHIDWNVTARMDELHVREYLQERELTAWLLLDRSPSMDFGTAGRTKEQVLCELSAAIALLLVGGGNRVGAILSDGERHWTLPPRQGRHQVVALVNELQRPVEGASRTQLDVLLRSAGRMLRRRSLVVVVSDFFCEPGWERPLGQLAVRHELVALRLVDPAENSLPDAGMLYVQDAESGEQLLVDSSDPVLRRRLGQLWAERDEAVRHCIARCGVRPHVVSTDDDLLSALLRIARAGRARR
ncbi:MAG TPA: DUF58 domain-containing protein [Acidimicrobiales bacterium]|nr:DUF58 domain-containing protein [Acidimicrobiales bacterium]